MTSEAAERGSACGHPGAGDGGDPVRFDPWIDDLHYRGGGQEYAHLVAEFRDFMGALAASRPPEADLRRAARGLAELRAMLEQHRCALGEG